MAHKCRGPWSYYLLAGRRADGSRRQITRSGFATKRVAQVGLQEALAREDAGVAEVHGLTVGDFLDQWLNGKRSLRPTTRDGYRLDIERHLIPALGSIRLADLRPHHIDQLYSELLKGAAGHPTTPSVIRHTHTTLRSALGTAVRRRLIPWNPAQHVELPEEGRRATTVWTPAEVNQFLRLHEGHRLGLLYRLVAVAGLRRGEVLGLHWSDVDLAAGAFTVRWQLVNTRSGPSLGPPKTRSGARVVALDAGTTAALAKHKAEQAKERVAWGDAVVENDLVFTRENSEPLRPEYVTHAFRRLAANAGLPPIRLHDLRHTNASLALAFV